MIDRFVAYLDDVDNWLKASRLRPNTSKTHVTWLGSSQQLQRLNIPHVDIQSTRVDVVDTARDLGVIIDSQLFSAQVADLSRSVSFQLRQLRPIIRSLTMEAAKTITQAFISCRLDYCNSLFLTVWYSRSFPAAGPEVWNSLPPALRGSELTFDRFKQVLKTYFTLVMKSQRLVIIDFGAIYVCIVCIGE